MFSLTSSYFWLSIRTEFNLEAMRLQTALIYDGVILLTETFKQLGLEQIEPTSIVCMGNDTMWEKGMSISNFMRNVSLLSMNLSHDLCYFVCALYGVNMNSFHYDADSHRWNNEKCEIRRKWPSNRVRSSGIAAEYTRCCADGNVEH